MAYCPRCEGNYPIVVRHGYPHCSNCYFELEFPSATSKEEYLDTKRKWAKKRAEMEAKEVEDFQDKLTSYGCLIVMFIIWILIVLLSSYL